MIGKKIRLERIVDRNTRRTVIVPLDHGMTVGPIPGLIQIPPIANLIAEGGGNAAIVHRGAAMFGHRGTEKISGLSSTSPPAQPSRRTRTGRFSWPPWRTRSG